MIVSTDVTFAGNKIVRPASISRPNSWACFRRIARYWICSGKKWQFRSCSSKKFCLIETIVNWFALATTSCLVSEFSGQALWERRTSITAAFSWGNKCHNDCKHVIGASKVTRTWVQKNWPMFRTFWPESSATGNYRGFINGSSSMYEGVTTDGPSWLLTNKSHHFSWPT